MEPNNTPKISLLIPLLSLLLLNSISPSLSHLPLAPEISPAPQPSTSESVPDEENPFLENICKSTDYPDLCLDTISPLLKGKTDIISVLDAAMNAGLETTNAAILLAKKLSTMPGTSPGMVSILSDCKNSYEDAKENFEKAIGGLPIGDIGLMNSMLSAVITDVSDCEDGYSGNVSPLSPYSEKIVNMTSNCLAIVSLIPEHVKYITLG